MNQFNEFEQVRLLTLRMGYALDRLAGKARIIDYITPAEQAEACAKMRQLAEEIHEDATTLRQVTLRWCDRLAGEENQ
ncbi:hypothetical protein INS90_10235 [Trueperella pecoris]|uniref:Uncharacterized protein n=1 Tax=Trueperella pecoris TaxID=2733571 RepID=A0A7M1R2B8_9ACTO|nr:hypothetical protein [Trueperella pecoris]QOR47607.1 hypothetical protein INS90_10235 [Trueperella pecoris]